MAITVTAAECIEEGQLKLDYFPNCATALALNTMIEGKITEQGVRIKRQVGAATWATADADIISELENALLYSTCARLWHMILQVMVGYDAESLPPEYVDPPAAERIRDYFAEQAISIIAAYESTATPGINSFIGAFDSDTIDDADNENIFGLSY
jgi:hypothetical protein